jgi:predicted metal-dependent hydrolase
VKSINLQGKTIKYEARKSRRARSLRLTINLDGDLIVTMPWFVGNWQAKMFMKSKSDWILKGIEKTRKRANKFFIPKTNKRDYKELKEKSRLIVTDKVKEFNQYYNYDYNRIFIRNQKTRWGSCSGKKNLNYNYRLALLPEKYLDYVVVHELCHLKEMNHSRNFWSLVSETVPNYKAIKREMRNMQ